MKAGMDIGFSMPANDNDGVKRRGWIEYMSGIGLGKDRPPSGIWCWSDSEDSRFSAP